MLGQWVKRKTGDEFNDFNSASTTAGLASSSFFSGRPILIDSMSSGDMLNVVSKLSTVEEDTRALGLFSLQADTGRIFSGICCN